MNGDQFDITADVFEGRGDGFLARGSPFDDMHGLAEFFLAAKFFYALHFIGAGSKNDFGDGVAGGKAAQGVQEDRGAVELQKLLGRFAAHARAHSSGGQAGSDFGHRKFWGNREADDPSVCPAAVAPRDSVYLKRRTETRRHPASRNKID